MPYSGTELALGLKILMEQTDFVLKRKEKRTGLGQHHHHHDSLSGQSGTTMRQVQCRPVLLSAATFQRDSVHV